MAYGSVSGTQAYIRHMTLDTPKSPKTTDVQGWLTGRSAILDGWIAAAGYTVPVGVAGAVAALDRYANIGAAADAELAQRSAGSSSDSNKRENKLISEFDKAKAWIESGALRALGVPLAAEVVPSGMPQIGVLTAGTTVELPARLGRPPELDYRFGR